ncbi:MAG: glutathione S-transferase C-terminal domain-containing protein [Rhizomicrobium sp.]
MIGEPGDGTVIHVHKLYALHRYEDSALSGFGGAGGYLFGSFTIADCMYAPVVSRFRTYGIALDPALDAYCSRIMDLPAMRDWLAAAQKEIDEGLPQLQ